MKGDYEFLKNSNYNLDKRIKKYYEKMKEWEDNEKDMTEREKSKKMDELRDEHFKLIDESSFYKELDLKLQAELAKKPYYPPEEQSQVMKDPEIKKAYEKRE